MTRKATKAKRAKAKPKSGRAARRATPEKSLPPEWQMDPPKVPKPGPVTVYPYTLGVTLNADKYLQFNYIQHSPVLIPPALVAGKRIKGLSKAKDFDVVIEGPLDISITKEVEGKNCRLQFQLDKTQVNWEFRKDNPITLKKKGMGRYYDLQTAVDAGGKILYVTVMVDYAGSEPHMQRDGFNIHVLVDQQKNGKPARPLEIIIDPDIKNPGDHPPDLTS